MGLEFEGISASGTAIIQGHSPAQDVLIMQTRVVPNTAHAGFASAVSTPDKLFIVKNDGRCFGHGTGGNIIYSMSRRLALLGNHLKDASGGEHIARIVECKKGVISHNYFAHPARSKALLTLRSRDNSETHEVFVSDNTFITDWGNVGMINGNASTRSPYGRDIILERNFFRRLLTVGEASTFAINTESVDRVTIRNNIPLFQRLGPTLVGGRDDRSKPVNSL